MIKIAKGTERAILDYHLSRYTCYLIGKYRLVEINKQMKNDHFVGVDKMVQKTIKKDVFLNSGKHQKVI